MVVVGATRPNFIIYENILLIGRLNAVSPSCLSFVDSSVSRPLLRPEEETVAAIMDILIQNWVPLLRTKLDTNPLTKSSVSAVASPVSSSGTAKASPGPIPSTLLQTVIFDSSKMQEAVQSVTLLSSS